MTADAHESDDAGRLKRLWRRLRGKGPMEVAADRPASAPEITDEQSSATWRVARLNAADPDPFARDIQIVRLEAEPTNGEDPAGDFRTELAQALDKIRAMYAPSEGASDADSARLGERFATALDRLYRLAVFALATKDDNIADAGAALAVLRSDILVAEAERIMGRSRRTAEPAVTSSYRSDRWQIAKYQWNDWAPFDRDIYFAPRKVAGKTDASVESSELEFKAKVERTLSTLKALYRPVEPPERGRLRRFLSFLSFDDGGRQSFRAEQDERAKRFSDASDRLFTLTALGLGTNGTELKVAEGALTSLREDVLRREAGPIKNGYMRKLGKPALLASVLLTLLYLLFDNSRGFYSDICVGEMLKNKMVCSTLGEGEYRVQFPSEGYEYRSLFLLLAGCMVGTWASFAARNVTLTFDHLAELEQDRLAPSMRLVFTGTLTLILSLILLSGIVQVDIGGFSTQDLRASGLVALLIGAFFGLLEQALPAAVMDRARGFVESVSGK